MPPPGFVSHASFSSRNAHRRNARGCAFLFFLLKLQATFGATNAPNSSSLVYLADLHLGEGCASSAKGYQPSDLNCYSVHNLKQTVERVNVLIAASAGGGSPIRLVVVGGDVTASAQRSEFVAAKAYLDELTVPYVAMLGNHDVWSYDETVGDRTDQPMGDELFASIFAPTFAALGRFRGFSYPNSTSGSATARRRFQSWMLQLDSHDLGPSFDGLTLIAPDFNTRLKAPPPCPGHSPIGGCGVLGMASLNNESGGAWPWFEHQLDVLAASRTARVNRSILLLTHQPFRCRLPIPE